MASIQNQIDAEWEVRNAASMTHMSDADVRYWVDRLTAERSEPLYRIQVSIRDQDRAGDELHRYRRELARRECLALIPTHSNTEAA